MPEDNDSSGILNAKCPICKKPVTALYRPFCSRRCADVDLHHWLKGNYAIPAEDNAEPDAFESEENEQNQIPSAGEQEERGKLVPFPTKGKRR